MATCEDCICYEILCQHTLQDDELKLCDSFKNKADYEEVKHGEWKKCQKLYGVGYEYVCSVCEKGIRQYEGQPICSECSAKMDSQL